MVKQWGKGRHRWQTGGCDTTWCFTAKQNAFGAWCYVRNNHNNKATFRTKQAMLWKYECQVIWRMWFSFVRIESENNISLNTNHVLFFFFFLQHLKPHQLQHLESTRNKPKSKIPHAQIKVARTGIRCLLSEATAHQRLTPLMSFSWSLLVAHWYEAIS